MPFCKSLDIFTVGGSGDGVVTNSAATEAVLVFGTGQQRLGNLSEIPMSREQQERCEDADD